MKWILITWFVTTGSGGLSVTTMDVEFNSEMACRAAGAAIQHEARAETVRFVCVSKGEGPAE